MALLRTAIAVLVIAAAAAIVGLVLYKVIRLVIERQLDIDGWLPQIEWTLRAFPKTEDIWPKLVYPTFPKSSPLSMPSIQGTSGAWRV